MRPQLSEPIRRAARSATGRPRVEDLFRANRGRLIHKCPHYFDIYEQHLRRFQGTAPTVLEIGVFHGGSLDMWKRYFGRSSTIVGLDVDPRTAALDDPPRVHVRVGDQSDPAVLQSVIDEFGPFDIVIDDGSHIPSHQLASLEHLWPAVAVGGVYLVEDLCTSYWSEYTGGPGHRTFMDLTRELVDAINAFNSRDDQLVPSTWTHQVTGMHVHDSIVVLDRGDHVPLTTEMTGQPTFTDDAGQVDGSELTDAYRAQLAEQQVRDRRRQALLGALPPVVRRALRRVRRAIG